MVRNPAKSTWTTSLARFVVQPGLDNSPEPNLPSAACTNAAEGPFA